MDILFFAFMEEQRELILTDDFSHGADGTEIAGGQGCQRVNIVLLFAIIQIGNDISLGFLRLKVSESVEQLKVILEPLLSL